MHAAKNGLARMSVKACDNLVDGISKLNLVELKEKPELVGTLKKQLREENEVLRQQIEAMKAKLNELQAKLPKAISNEEYPLKTPQVLSTTRLFGDALLKNTGDPNRNPTSKADESTAGDFAKEPKDAAKDVAKDVAKQQQQQQQQQQQKQKQPKEAKQKDPKPKGGNKQAAKEPENEKIDASRLNMLVGKVVEVNRHPDAEKLYVEKIDLGEEQPRTVVSGLVDYVPEDKFLNKLVVVLCNLKASKLRGVLSEAMVMCASDKENNKVELLEPPSDAQPGDRIVFDKFPGEPDTQLNPKKKIWEQVAVDLKTDANKVACYKDDPFRVKDKGVVTAPTLANTIIR